MWLEAFGEIDQLVFYVFCAIAGAIALMAVANLIVGLCQRDTSPSLSIDFNVISGGLLLTVTVLVRGIRPDGTEVLVIFCDLYKALLLIGLTQFVGGLFVKSWSMYLYNTFNKDKKPLSEEWKPNLWIWILLVIIGAVIIVWSVVYEPASLRPVVAEMKLLKCSKQPHDFEWKTATSVWHAFLLLLAVIAVPVNCYKAPNVQANLLSAIVFNTLFSVVAAVVVHFTYDGTRKADGRTADYAINGGLMLWTVLFASILLLISKLEEPRRLRQLKVCIGDGGKSDDGDDGAYDRESQYDTIESDKRMSQRDSGLDAEGGRPLADYTNPPVNNGTYENINNGEMPGPPPPPPPPPPPEGAVDGGDGGSTEVFNY